MERKRAVVAALGGSALLVGTLLAVGPTGPAAADSPHQTLAVSNGGPGDPSATLSGAHTVSPGAPPPSVTRINPDRGPTVGGTRVTITGSGFVTGTTVTVGGVACKPVTVISSTSLTCLTGHRRTGTVGVAVTTPEGRAELPKAFSYERTADLTVKAITKANALAMNRTTKVVRDVATTGKTTITATCRVNGHHLRRACEIRIRPAKQQVLVTPRCNDDVRVTVRIVARTAGERDVWQRQWRVDRQPAVTCSANANG